MKDSEFIGECDILLAEGIRSLRYATPKVIKFVGDYVRKKVPEQNRTIPDPRILKDLLENISFITDEDLREMFLNLLASSCDSTKNHLAHPAYALILTQLNRDEAILIKYYYDQNIEGYESVHLVEKTDDEIRTDVLKCGVENIAALNLYIEHLISLSVLKIYHSAISVDNKNEYIGISKFGKLFAQACIPSISSSSSSLA